MVRILFRTAFIGMMAVAGLFLLFFVIRVIFFFLIVGFFIRMIGRYTRQHSMAAYAHAHSSDWRHSSHQVPENILGYPRHAPASYSYAARPPQTAIIEIDR